MARRFAAGATMWCVAPQWPAHAEHLAVEMVHPVVAGARALPARAVAGADPVAAVRCMTRRGDVIAVIARGDDAAAVDLVRRAPAWGATTVWLGTGPAPDGSRPDHAVWLTHDGAEPDDERWAVHGGGLVLAYHLLWELTQVCLEHPGLLADERPEQRCVTCSDDASATEVTRVLGDGLVEVRSAEGPRTVDARLVGDVVPGDVLLVHAGAAISRVAPEPEPAAEVGA